MKSIDRNIIYLIAAFGVSFFVISLLSGTINFGGKEQKVSGAYRALEFWTNSRAYPNKDIPHDKFYSEFVEVKQNKLNKTDENYEWKPLGPMNVPGRIIGLAVNPQNSKTLYAGSASGGLWRTYNSGSGGYWNRIDTGFPVLGVMAIAVDYEDTNNIYIGTGEVYGYRRSIGGTVIRTTRGSYGIGILKSTDGGNTWSKSLDWSMEQRRGVQALEINPLNPRSIYAATSEGIYRSVDAGESWDLLLDVEMGQDIIIHPSDTNKVIVSCGNLGSSNSGVYKSTDDGNTWNKVSGLPAYTGKTLMDYYALNPNIIFASVADSLEGKGLFKSQNFGDSWQKISSDDVPRYQGFFAHWVAVHPQDVNKLIYAGVEIYYSTDGASTLQRNSYPHVDHHVYAHDPNNPGVLFIGCDGGVYRTDDFGQNFTNIGYGLLTSQFYNGFSNSFSDSNFAIGGLQDNNTVIYSGSNSWRRVIGGDGSWTAINAENDNYVYGSYQYNNIYRSTNRGANFSFISNNIPADNLTAFIAPYVISISNPDVLYTGRGKIYKSTNNGDTWVVKNNDNVFDGNPFLSMAVSEQDENVVYAATAPVGIRSHVYVTFKGWDTWNDVTGNLPDRYPMDIAVDPSDHNTAYIVYSGYGTGHVFKTVNAGSDWSDISGTLPDVPTSSVVVDPFNIDHVYIGNDLGVFVSRNKGESWQELDEGLPEAIIAMDLSVSRVNKSLRLASHGNGAWQMKLLSNLTTTFTYDPDNLPDSLLQNTDVQFRGFVVNTGPDQTDSLILGMSILDKLGSKVHEDELTFCCLDLNTERSVAFGNTFNFESQGEYSIEYSFYDNEGNFLNFAGSQSIKVIKIPSIANYQVSKIYKPYEELSSRIDFTPGDDVQNQWFLPFPFYFDEYPYTKIQVSSNGWLEFGDGNDGTERGVSTLTQIGLYGAGENGRMAKKNRPTKALGPWWEDLSADSDNIEGGGSMGIATLGSSPNRVFVVEWKDMLAYYDADNTTTRVSFQVRLYENNNVIEFHYGPVQFGFFGGADVGASIGFKDHIGGNYHFYDIARGGLGTRETIETTLYPLFNWPGPDSAYVITYDPTDVEDDIFDDEINQPDNFVLHQNYPNPFNPSTTIMYSIPVVEPNAVWHNGQERFSESLYNITLKVYDMLGQEITTLVNQEQRPGSYEIIFDASGLASGVYFYNLTIDSPSTGSGRIFLETKKMLLLR